jgi:cell division transport system ATP-binding protein
LIKAGFGILRKHQTDPSTLNPESRIREPVINFSQVCKRYPGGFEALKNISFSIETGEMVFITGHSGAGKSTLLKLMTAIERPTSGSVIVNGQNVGAMRPRAIPFLRRNFGLIFQDHKLLFDRNVFDNVMLPLNIRGFDRREAARRARAALDKVGLLSKEKARPITLSGGEQQRVCIARAIVHRPAILLADEPTGNLDAAYASDLGELFKSFNQVGVTVVIATHDENLAARLKPRTITLMRGTLAAENAPVAT